MGNHKEAEQMFHRAIAAKYEIIKRNKDNLINWNEVEYKNTHILVSEE